LVICIGIGYFPFHIDASLMDLFKVKCGHGVLAHGCRHDPVIWTVKTSMKICATGNIE
jgi:hypothetical protein